MFKKAIFVAAIATAAAPVIAGDSAKEKHFSVGIASSATVISTSYEDFDFAGFSIFGTGAINDHLGFRLAYAKQSLEDNSDVKLDALEASFIAGTGLATTGFKAYGSVGVYSETIKQSGYSEDDFSGAMFGGGIGYNWSPVSLEFWVNLRSTGDYEDLFGDIDVAAASGGLGLSARF